MAKARKKTNPRRTEGAGPRKPVRIAPDKWLASLALLGILLTAYLFWVHAFGDSALFCTDGDGCDVVQESQWSTLLGIPIALWGMGLYALIGLVAMTGNSVAVRWRRLFTLVMIGMLISLYLTAVGWIALEAFCAWCLFSLALMVAILVRVLMQRPNQGPAAGWSRWLLVHAIVLLPLLGLVMAAQAGWLAPADDPRLEPLAQHLAASDVKFYGTFWCPECQKQKRLFGRAADSLPYVECSPNGRNGPMAYECARAGIESYPTWVIRGQSTAGLMQPQELARRSRFHKWNATGTETPATR